MIRILCFIGLSLYFSADLIWAGTSPMAEKHIFTPENISEQKEEVLPGSKVISPALDKELLFTGVLVTPKGKSVILRENVKNDKDGIKHVLKQGDQIKGKTILEIGSNYVLLSGKEGVAEKLNLYKGAKTRPAPVLAETKPDVPAGPNLKQVMPGAPNADQSQNTPLGAPGAGKELPSPFGGNSQKGDGPPQQQSGEAPQNPFVDLLNKTPRKAPGATPTNPFNALPLNQ